MGFCSYPGSMKTYVGDETVGYPRSMKIFVNDVAQW